MRWTTYLLLLTVFFLTACDQPLNFRTALPFPTPGQHDLVVLLQPGPLTYSSDESGTAAGLERDLIEAFALELGVGVQYIMVSPAELEERLNQESYHLASAWLSPRADSGLQATSPIIETSDVLAQHEASLPLSKTAQLAGKTVHAMAGSRQAATLRALKNTIPDLGIVEVEQGNILDLLEQLGKGRVEYVAMDAQLEEIANQFAPYLRTTLKLGEAQPIVWLLGRQPNAEMAARASAFVEKIRHDGTLARLQDRYFGHVQRLTQVDVETFLGQIETKLPKLRKWFENAERITNLDWRLIAAVAYHESHWDPNATSYTNVRGIMMLTEETADRLGVSNRLDPRESILAGARYLNLLKDGMPEELAEPDRTWMALAAYNIGPGHFNAARNLAKMLKVDANSWFDMKQVLPLLAQPKYYERVKSGRARGGEAVILVENIRSYYDILVRNQSALKAATPRIEGVIGIDAGRATAPGLKLKR